MEAIYREMWRELRGADYRRKMPTGETERAMIFRRYEEMHGVTKTSFYRWQKAAGLRNPKSEIRKTPHNPPNEIRKPPFDSPHKMEGREQQIKAIFELQARLSDAQAHRWLPSDHVLTLAVQEGLMEAGEFSERTYNRWVQKFGLRKPRGFVRFQADYSNQMHQLDASGSEYLQVVRQTEDGDWVLAKRVPLRGGKNRKQQPQRLWIAGLVDDFSGALVCRYYVAKGESASWIRHFLLSAWEGLDKGIVVRGIPEMLYVDNGPFARNETTISFLSAKTGLGVELKVSKPYASRSHGKIERTWRTLWQRFELFYLGENRELLLSELNRCLVTYIIEYNQRLHRSGFGTRAEMFVSHLQGRVRIPPKEGKKSAYRIHDRMIDGGGMFSFKGKTYIVEPEHREELRQIRAMVYETADGEVFIESPMADVIARAEVWTGSKALGEFESFPETEMDKVDKERMAGIGLQIQSPYAVENDAESVMEVGDVRVYKTGEKVLVGVKSAQMENKSPLMKADRFISENQARLYIAQRWGVSLLELRATAPGLMDAIEALLQETLDRDRIKEWCDGNLGKLQQAMGM